MEKRSKTYVLLAGGKGVCAGSKEEMEKLKETLTPYNSSLTIVERDD